MLRAAPICLLLAALLAGLAWWGLFTPGGRTTFEVAEMIPFAAGTASALLAICGFITWGMSRRR